MASQPNGGWIFSEAHQDHYYVTYDQSGNIVYLWAKQQTQQPAAAPVTSTTSYHNRIDSQQTVVGQNTQVNGGYSQLAASSTTGGAEASPAEAVPLEIRRREPNFIAGTPESGWYDKLDQSYYMRTGAQARAFFILGRVFSMLYTEAASQNAPIAPDDEAFTIVRFGARAHTQIRRFVVVSVRRNYVHACAISTYRNQGTFKKGCDPSEHALICNYEVDPETCYFAGERERGMKKEPIRVKAASASTNLTRESRIRFGKIYSIEWNVKVKDIGVVIDQDLGTLRAHHHSETIRWDTAN